MPEQRNLILAIVLSVTIIIAFQYFYELPRLKQAERQQAQRTEQMAETPQQQPAADAKPRRPRRPARPTRRARKRSRPPRASRLPTATVEGSLALTGGRIDNLVLSRFRETTAPDSPNVRLLNPPGAPDAYFAEFGWVPARSGHRGARPRYRMAGRRREDPSRRAGHAELGQRRGSALRAHRRGSTSTTCSRSPSGSRTRATPSVSLHPYGLISRWGTPETLGFYILHEGPIGVLGGKLHEIDYTDLQEDGDVELPSVGGWMGITDKYWLTSLVPDQDADLVANFRHSWPMGRTATRSTTCARRSASPRARASRSPTASSPAPKRSSCSTLTPSGTVFRCSIARSTSAGSTS